MPKGWITRIGEDEDATAEDIAVPAFGNRLACSLLDEQLTGVPSFYPPRNDLFIEWIYTIDLDYQVFSVNNKFFFRLDEIPRSKFPRAVGKDQRKRLPLDQYLRPGESIGLVTSMSIVMPPTSFDLPFVKIKPKRFAAFDVQVMHGVEYVLRVWAQLKISLESALSGCVDYMTPDDPAFRDAAFAIVSLCTRSAGSTSAYNTDQCVLGDGYSLLRDQEDTHMASDLGQGFYVDGDPPDLAPSGTTYWHHEVLVCLRSQLKDDLKVESALADAIQLARSTQQKPQTFDVLLLSLQQMVIARVFEDHVQRTESLSLLICPYPVFDSLAGMQHELEVERSDSEGHGTDSDADNSDDQCFYESDEESGASRYRKPSASELNSLTPLLHLFETAAVARLRPQRRSGEGCFPTEIFEQIMHYVDAHTNQQCALVSRKLRAISQRTFHVSSETQLLSDPRPYEENGRSLRLFDGTSGEFLVHNISDGQTVRAAMIALPEDYRRSRDQDRRKETFWMETVRHREILLKLAVIGFRGVKSTVRMDSFEDRVQKALSTTATPYSLPTANYSFESTHFWDNLHVLTRWEMLQGVLSAHNLVEFWGRGIIDLYVCKGMMMCAAEQNFLLRNTIHTNFVAFPGDTATHVVHIGCKQTNISMNEQEAWALLESETTERVSVFP